MEEYWAARKGDGKSVVAELETVPNRGVGCGPTWLQNETKAW